ncbi:hypothetical protein BSIN_2977 [Burkholderia singularis]|uniref:Uncharacterized protein n=1 Tax=Burkholderia singularis TaxID=1503053 RepID=A0A238H393_9BURK|nr:hypothetical protein BSIN_2977 [Burkholderia singularis]
MTNAYSSVGTFRRRRGERRWARRVRQSRSMQIDDLRGTDGRRCCRWHEAKWKG